MAKSKINWTEHTWNPIAGCTKCSPGCLNCYAERMSNRLAAMGQEKYDKVVAFDSDINSPNDGKYFGWNHKIYCDESALDIPLKRKKPTTYFVNSMSDTFHPDVPREFIARIFDVACKGYIDKGHIFQFLTKRVKRMGEEIAIWSHLRGYDMTKLYGFHFGVSICTQAEADEKIPILLQIPAAKRFISLEPLLEDIKISKFLLPQFEHIIGIYKNKGKEFIKPDQVIIGCESLGGRAGRFQDGFGLAAAHIIDQCKAAGVQFFMKQWPNEKGKVVKTKQQFRYKI